MVSLIFLAIGNLFYALALQCNSPYFIFIGRLFTGAYITVIIYKRVILEVEIRVFVTTHAQTFGLSFSSVPLIMLLYSVAHFQFLSCLCRHLPSFMCVALSPSRLHALSLPLSYCLSVSVSLSLILLLSLPLPSHAIPLIRTWRPQGDHKAIHS